MSAVADASRVSRDVRLFDPSRQDIVLASQEPSTGASNVYVVEIKVYFCEAPELRTPREVLADTELSSDDQPPTWRGHRFRTEEEVAEMDCPLPREPQWEGG